jgi:hypothetical protein
MERCALSQLAHRKFAQSLQREIAFSLLLHDMHMRVSMSMVARSKMFVRIKWKGRCADVAPLGTLKRKEMFSYD